MSFSILILAAYTYTDGIPAFSDYFINILPTEFSIEIGKKIRNEVLDDFMVDELNTDKINEFSKKLNLDKNVKVYVINSNEINAFATPGKYIFVHSALIKSLNNYAELAGLLSHEYIHIDQNHGLRSVGRTMGYEIFTSIFISKNLKQKLFEKSNMLINLEYSRAFEKEADLKGLKLLEKEKIDPNGMLSLMKILQKFERKQKEELSDHPLTIDRIEYLEEEIEMMKYSPIENKELQNLFNEIKASIH